MLKRFLRRRWMKKRLALAVAGYRRSVVWKARRASPRAARARRSAPTRMSGGGTRQPAPRRAGAPTSPRCRPSGPATRSGSTSSPFPTARSRSAAPLTDGCSRPFPRRATGRATRCGPIPRSPRILDGQPLARKLGERREQVALLLERAAGPVLHNSTRGDALLPNARRYGTFLGGVGRDLRAVRRARGNRPGAGHPRIGPERHEALGSQRRRVLPVAPEELEAAELLLADAHRGAEPDDAGALLRRVPVGARHQVRIVHSRALRAQRRRHERRADADQRRAPRCRRTCAPDISWARSWPATCARCRARTTRTSIGATARARISTRRWCSATRSTSGT